MVKVTFNENAINKAFGDLEKQVRFAASLALNRTARVVREELKGEMQEVFDRPTPFTLNSLRITPATKQKLEATVWFRNPTRLSDPHHYLEPQVFGGGRAIKRFEHWLHQAGHLPRGWFTVPGAAARKDGYGNMSRGQIVQILSALQAMPNPDANRPHRYGLTRGSRRPGKQPIFVVVKPGGKLRPGVWLREERSFQQVLAFVPGLSYQKRFRLFEIAHRVMQREMPRQFQRALQQARATARPDG